MLQRLIKRLQQLKAKLNNFIKWGMSKSKLIGVIFAISRVEKQIESIKEEPKPLPSILGNYNPRVCANSGIKDRYGCAYWVAVQINQGFDRKALIEGVKKDSPHIKVWGNFEELIEDALEELKNDYIPQWCQAKG